MVTYSDIPAWRIPRTEEPGGLQFMELQRVRHNWATEHMHTGTLVSQLVCFTNSGYFEAVMTLRYVSHSSPHKWAVGIFTWRAPTAFMRLSKRVEEKLKTTNRWHFFQMPTILSTMNSHFTYNCLLSCCVRLWSGWDAGRTEQQEQLVLTISNRNPRTSSNLVNFPWSTWMNFLSWKTPVGEEVVLEEKIVRRSGKHRKMKEIKNKIHVWC